MPQMTKLGENQAIYTMNNLPWHKLSIFTQLSHTYNIQFNISDLQETLPYTNCTITTIINFSIQELNL